VPPRGSWFASSRHAKNEVREHITGPKTIFVGQIEPRAVGRANFEKRDAGYHRHAELAMMAWKVREHARSASAGAIPIHDGRHRLNAEVKKASRSSPSGRWRSTRLMKEVSKAEAGVGENEGDGHHRPEFQPRAGSTEW